MHQATEEATIRECQERGIEPALYRLGENQLFSMYDACESLFERLWLYSLDIALRKSSLVPLVTKIHTGFQPEMSLSSTIEESHVNSTLEETHVNSPNYYSLAHNSVDDCPDDVTGQFYTAPKTGVDAMVSFCLDMWSCAWSCVWSSSY